MKNNLNDEYWQGRWQNGHTPWDIGGVSPAILHYFDTIPKDARILIPGAGSGHEAIFLFQNGYSNVLVCDWAADAFTLLKRQLPGFPPEQMIQSDFFELDLKVDYIIEQTFFCAIDPGLRSTYVEKVHQLLNPGGEIGGLLFAKPFPFEGPPFGGNKTEYLSLFGTNFDVIEMEISAHSIGPRMGNELFFRCRPS